MTASRGFAPRSARRGPAATLQMNAKVKEGKMVKIPDRENSTRALIDEWHENQQERPRPHMGASLLGHHCERWLWLNFRWAVIEKFPGRILRVFRRGHHEENWFVSDLKAIGVDITNTGDDQSRVDLGCHVSGSIDGIIERGLPEAPKTRHIAEFKTHSKKSFDDLTKKGVEKSKPQHYAQMQVYMLGTGIDRAFYVAVNKDDDSLYTERVRLDKKIAGELVEKGKRLALAERIPEPCPGASPDWYLCKWCAAFDFCHAEASTKEVNCRTCANSTPKEDGTWACERWADTIPTEAQYNGCDAHALHPDLVPWAMVDSGVDFVAAYQIGGNIVLNGEGHRASVDLVSETVQAVYEGFKCN